MERKRGEVWAIILAAGEGTRMARLTSLVHGQAVPKQFAALDGERTMLQKTVDRLSGLVPGHRIVTVVGESQQDFARAQTKGHRGLTVLPQPIDLGTGPGVLYPLSFILARDPDARVLILPSDQHVRTTAGFVRVLRRALRAAEATPTGVAVLGAPPDRPEADLGWLMPDRKARPGRAGATTLRRVFDAAPSALEGMLEAMGGLWNTNVVVGSGAALWQLFEEHLPSQTAQFRRYLAHVGFPQERRVLEEIYWDTLPADFSREVIAKAEGISVLSTGDIGWADWGTPDRFLASVRGTAAFQVLLGRMARNPARQRPMHTATHVSMVVGAA